MEDIRRAETRLENIRSVEPILSALRTVSHGSWQAALKKKASVRSYGRQISRLIPWPLMALRPTTKITAGAVPQPARRIVALAVGSERGLCGQFNTQMLDSLDSYLQEKGAQGIQIELWAMGSRFERTLNRRKITFAWSDRFPAGGLPSFQLATLLAERLLKGYDEQRFDAVDVFFNRSLGATLTKPVIERLIPPASFPTTTEATHLPWPPPIVETDPLRLYTRLIEESISLQLYEFLLDSATAEHATRFHLMEEATQNAERLIDELNVVVQMARQQAITQQMQELAIGSGMLKT
jgi:F-type H+-transporting ATPase subunit gamma